MAAQNWSQPFGRPRPSMGMPSADGRTASSWAQPIGASPMPPDDSGAAWTSSGGVQPPVGYTRPPQYPGAAESGVNPGYARPNQGQALTPSQMQALSAARGLLAQNYAMPQMSQPDPRSQPSPYQTMPNTRPPQYPTAPLPPAPAPVTGGAPAALGGGWLQALMQRFMAQQRPPGTPSPQAMYQGGPPAAPSYAPGGGSPMPGGGAGSALPAYTTVPTNLPTPPGSDYGAGFGGGAGAVIPTIAGAFPTGGSANTFGGGAPGGGNGATVPQIYGTFANGTQMGGTAESANPFSGAGGFQGATVPQTYTSLPNPYTY